MLTPEEIAKFIDEDPDLFDEGKLKDWGKAGIELVKKKGPGVAKMAAKGAAKALETAGSAAVGAVKGAAETLASEDVGTPLSNREVMNTLIGLAQGYLDDHMGIAEVRYIGEILTAIQRVGELIGEPIPSETMQAMHQAYVPMGAAPYDAEEEEPEDISKYLYEPPEEQRKY